jgi:hypothetical protein
MREQSLDSVQEIEKIARNLLVEAKAWGRFPTPVDRIIQCAELSIKNGVDLSQVDAGLFVKSANFFGRISRKVLGVIDFRAKTIYLDESQQPKRKNFVTLHEIGHAVLPWQSELLGCKDDETTIVPEVKELYEREASIFASNSLFQVDRFDEEAGKLELGIRSARTVGNKFGGSVQAALRRYVERSRRRCSLLVLHRPEPSGPFRAKVRNYFESVSFEKAFGGLTWPEECGIEYPFVEDIHRKRRDHQDGQIGITTMSLDYVTLRYHFFDNGYNVFVFLFPPGEKTASRIRIIPATDGK